MVPSETFATLVYTANLTATPNGNANYVIADAFSLINKISKIDEVNPTSEKICAKP
jgi:hypothetical protein